jgi:peptidyl-prolyl cis-trans isomerase D
VLEVLRKNSKNAIIYVLFGVIIAVFIINFGPGGSKGGCEGVSGRAFAARVGGSTIPETEFRYAYIAQGFTAYPPQFARDQHLKERVMDKLIERELLAQEAERLGFDVSRKEVEQMIEDGRMYVLGMPRHADEFQKDGIFDYDRFKSVCQNRLGVTVQRFIEVQQRELLADKVRQLLLGGTKVTLDEVKADYEQKGLQVNLEFARFANRHYDDEVVIAPPEIEEFRKGHEEAIKKAYEDRPYLYKKIDKHAHLRRILAGVNKDGTEAEVARAKARIEEAARKVKAGQSFADVAKVMSEDPHTKMRGGDSGWRKKGFTGMGAALDEKVFAADVKEGAIIGPERTDRGFELVKVEGFREGDLTLEQVAGEIAEEQLRVEKLKARAKAEAEAAVAKIKAGKKMEEVFPKLPEGVEDLPNKPAAAPPSLQETGMFARRGDMVPEVGVSPELARQAFEGKPSDLIGPFEVASAWVVARIKERKEPDRDFFEKHKDEEVKKAEREKWVDVLGAWSKQRCVAARDEGMIKVNEEVLSYEGLQGTKTETKYEICGSPKVSLGGMLGGMGGM